MTFQDVWEPCNYSKCFTCSSLFPHVTQYSCTGIIDTMIFMNPAGIFDFVHLNPPAYSRKINQYREQVTRWYLARRRRLRLLLAYFFLDTVSSRLWVLLYVRRRLRLANRAFSAARDILVQRLRSRLRCFVRTHGLHKSPRQLTDCRRWFGVTLISRRGRRGGRRTGTSRHMVTSCRNGGGGRHRHVGRC